MKLTITADAYALISDLSVDDIELLKKFNPDALKIKDKDGNDVFGVAYVEGKPQTSSFGVQFSGKTRDAAGKATITGMIPSDVRTADAAKEFVANTFGGVVAHLKQLEESVPNAAKEVREGRKALVDSIVVAG